MDGNAKKEKFCPINSIDAPNYEECLKDKCAFYNVYDRECALLTMAKALKSINRILLMAHRDVI